MRVDVKQRSMVSTLTGKACEDKSVVTGIG
jgi:hypothetical protein